MSYNHLSTVLKAVDLFYNSLDGYENKLAVILSLGKMANECERASLTHKDMQACDDAATTIYSMAQYLEALK